MSLQSTLKLPRATASRWLRYAGLAVAMAAGALTQSASAQSYTWKNVEMVGGGFVPGIIFNETEANLVYARTDMGGAYRMDPVTKRWIPMTDWIGWDDWNLTGIASLATDPVETNRLYLAAGTYTNDFSTQNGAILRSTDKGATWSRTDLPFKLGGNMPGRGCGERLAIDPSANNILYLAAPSGNGLWKSTDYGASWAKVNSFPVVGDYIAIPGDSYQGDNQGLYWVVFDKDTATAGGCQTIYVGVATLTGPCVYRSTNGGSSWAAVPGCPVGYVPHQGKLDTLNNYLYIATSDNGGPYDGLKGQVWRLNTTSDVWTNISPLNLTDTYFGYSGLSIDRQNPSIVMVTGYSSWWPDTHIWRSTNSGTTWTRIWDFTSYPERSFRYVHDITAAPWLNLFPGIASPEVSPKLGWMTEALAIDPHNSNRFMYGTGATIYGSEDLVKWDQGQQITIKVMAQGLEELAVQDLVSPPAGPPLLSAVADVNGFKHDNLTTVPAQTFMNPPWSNSTGLDYAELNPTFIARAGEGTPGNGPGTSKSVATSTNSGATWTPWSSQEPAAYTGGGGKIAVNANGTRLLWAAAGINVQTAPMGGNWVTATGLPIGTWQRPAIASDRVNANKFYAFVDRTFYISTNGGVSFTATPASAGFPFDRVKIKATPGVEGDIWLVGGATWDTYGLWHSTDSGTSFTKITAVTEADNVALGKAANGQTYPTVFVCGRIGGARGIHRSTDAGASWMLLNDAQHQYGQLGATALAGDPRTFGRVYCGTNGRGILYADEVPATVPPTAPSNPAASAVSSSQINLSWNDNSNNESGFEVDRATNPAFTANLVTSVAAANVTSYQASGLSGSTTYYFRVRATNSAGDSANTSTVSATTAQAQPPLAPSNPAASAVSSSQINVSWTDNSGDETGFEIDRATDSAFTANLVTSTTAPNVTSYPATGLSASTTYYFRVRATNAVGDSANTSTVSATTQAQAPAAPSNLVALVISTSQIDLTWTDNSGNETGFEVDRATNSTFSANLVMSTTGANVTSYQATGLTAATRYYFRVRATNAVGDSANSNVVNATTKRK